MKSKDAVRFMLDTSQLNRLANNFAKNQAYIFLIPFTENYEVIRYRRKLLTKTMALDIFDIPNLYKRTQKTRTIRLYKHATVTGTPRIEIADPRKYQPIHKVLTVAELGRMVSTQDIGYRIIDKEIRQDRQEKIGVRKLYYLHFSNLK